MIQRIFAALGPPLNLIKLCSINIPHAKGMHYQFAGNHGFKPDVPKCV